MNRILKKAAAGALAICLAAALCGCDRGYLMKVDGMDIRNGVYISYLQTAYYAAESRYAELHPEEGGDDDEVEFDFISDDSSEWDDEDMSSDDSDSGLGEFVEDDEDEDEDEDDTPITDKEIDGKNGSDWIKAETLKYIRKYVCIKRKCEEKGIKLTDEELADISSDTNDSWDSENQIVQLIYGFRTLGEYYESLGIGKESVKDIAQVELLESKLFMDYYGEDGEFEVSEDEINKYLEENYASALILEVKYTDAHGKALEKEEDIKVLREDAKKYAERLNKGDKAVDVFYDFEYKTELEKAKHEAEESYKEDNEDGLSLEEWIKKETEDVEVEKEEHEEDLITVVNKDDDDYDKKVIEHLFDTKTLDKAEVIETDKASYVVVKRDITKNKEWIEDNNESTLKELRGDDFDELLENDAMLYEVKADENLINKKYAPKIFND